MSLQAVEVSKALQTMSAQRVLVVGTVRDCEGALRKDVESIRVATQGFRGVSWLLVESDSSDGTGKVLEALSEEIPDFRYLTLGNLREKFPSRTNRIAQARNTYLTELESNPEYAEIDVVMVADMDGMNAALTADALVSCWASQGWDVCTANQRGRYYDIWALRHSLWSPNDCWELYRFYLAQGVSEQAARSRAISSRMIHVPEHGAWIEVDSAFGGLGIYRREALRGARYVGLNEAGYEVCEHVALHVAIREQGNRIFIHPGLVNAVIPEPAWRRNLGSALLRHVFGL